MSTSLWQQINGINYIHPLQCDAWRVVRENINHNPVRELVDNIYEAKILEDLRTRYSGIEFDQAAQEYHELLKKPFKHPPLQYPSRFGKKSERGIWYGSYEQLTALTESAYYWFYFLLGFGGKFSQIRNQCTAAKIGIKTAHGIELCKDPFLPHRSHISSPVDYATSQLLGSEMRDANVESFTFYSARHTNGSNVGVFEARAFKSKKPDRIEAWECEGDENEVVYYQSYNWFEKYKFSKKDFLIDSQFPFPAS